MAKTAHAKVLFISIVFSVYVSCSAKIVKLTLVVKSGPFNFNYLKRIVVTQGTDPSVSI